MKTISLKLAWAKVHTIVLLALTLLLFIPGTASAQFSSFDKNAIDSELEWLPASEEAFCASTADSSSSNIDFNSNNNVETAYKFFRLKGFSVEQASGIVGNLMSESGPTLDVTALNDGSSAYGIAQWLGGRKTRLIDFANGLGLEVESLETQLYYIWFELKGEPAVEGVDGATENRTYREMVEQTTVDNAVETWADFYERSGDKDYTKRKKFALQVYENFGGVTITGGLSNPVGCYSEGGAVTFDIIEGDTTNIPCEGNVKSEKLADGYRSGKLYKIRICVMYLADGVTQGPQVNSQISGAVTALLETATNQDIDLSGGGYRTMLAQKQARVRSCSDIDSLTDPDMYSRDANCNPLVARPGYSNHQMGLAVDFRCDTSGGNLMRSTDPCFEWMSLYAESFGLYNLPKEPWHWSIDGH